MFVEFFIDRPILSAVCSILIVLAGGVCIPFLPVAQYPQIAPPVVTVSAYYTGANAQVVESAVTIPLEQAINGVAGMKYLTSVSSNDGSCNITVVFDPARDLDVAAVDVQNRVATVQGRLPNEVKQTGVTVSKNASSFVLAIALYAEHGEYDQKFISNYADVFIKDAIKRVPGIAEVQMFGERKFAMRIWLNPNRLAERGLTAADVVAALEEQNIQAPAGQIGQPPAPRNKEFQISLQVEGRLTEPAEFENVILRADPNGTLIRIKDVGRAELGAEDYSTVLRFNGKAAIGLGVEQLSTANALDVRNKVLHTIETLAQRFPPGLVWVDAFDTTVAVSESIREIVVTLLEAIFFVVLVIYVFLRSGNSTLIPAITIPVSLIGTFAFVRLFHFSINTLTLFGLTLATGLVVDDAIVVIENIQRHVDERNMSVRAAASAAMKEVTGAVFATSLVLMAVFAPVAFLPGTTGRIYQQFSLTIAFSVALSMFSALTLTPALAARWLVSSHAESSANPDPNPKSKKRNPFLYPGELTSIMPRGRPWTIRAAQWVETVSARTTQALNRFQALLEEATRRYPIALRWVLDRPRLMLMAYGGVAAAALLLFVLVPAGFVPDEDQGFFIVMAQGPSGTSLGYTERVLDELDAILKDEKEIKSVFEVAGFSFGGNGPNRALSFVGLKSWKDRHASADDIIERLRGPLTDNQSAVLTPFTPPALEGVGDIGGLQLEIEDQAGTTVEQLAEATKNVVATSSDDPRLTGIYSGFTADDPQLYLHVDRERAKRMNVPLSDIFQTLQILTGSEYVNDFTFANRAYRVYVQADQEFRGNPKDLTSFYTRSHGGTEKGMTATGLPMPGASTISTGAMVSLDNLITIEPRVSAGEISHYNLFRSTEITGAPSAGRSSGQAMKAMEAAATASLPQGFGYEWSGLAKEQVEAGSTTVLIFSLALALVFLVLSAQYESFLLPIIILLSVPMGVVGGLGAQLLRGQSNDVFCQIGLVLLIGLSAKNAILIVEFAGQLRLRGHDAASAAIEATKERLRPILMTSFAFILGVFPLVLARGSGAQARHSLGTTVFGGMLLSTTVNLFFVPALYVFMDELRQGKLRVLLRRRLPVATTSPAPMELENTVPVEEKPAISKVVDLASQEITKITEPLRPPLVVEETVPFPRTEIPPPKPKPTPKKKPRVERDDLTHRVQKEEAGGEGDEPNKGEWEESTDVDND